MNTNEKGDMALGAAISWFTAHNYTVCIPLTESQDYDLIVEDKEKQILFKVEVKYSSYKRFGSYIVSLQSSSLRSGGGSVNKDLDTNRFDFLFIMSGDNCKYLIPSSDVKTKKKLTLSKYKEWMVN